MLSSKNAFPASKILLREGTTSCGPNRTCNFAKTVYSKSESFFLVARIDVCKILYWKGTPCGPNPRNFVEPKLMEVSHFRFVEQKTLAQRMISRLPKFYKGKGLLPVGLILPVIL